MADLGLKNRFMEAISNLTGISTSSGSSRVTKKALEQDDFLKLLVAQVTHQDPMKPQEDLSFIAEMAQFTSLEQTKVMQSDIARLHADSRLATANSLIGRKLTLDGEDGGVIEGVVSGVRVEGGVAKVVVEGKLYELDRINELTHSVAG